jgi:hypothetical protein
MQTKIIWQILFQFLCQYWVLLKQTCEILS